MSKKIVLALGGNALGDDLAGQMQAVKQTAQAIVDLIVGLRRPEPGLHWLRLTKRTP